MSPAPIINLQVWLSGRLDPRTGTMSFSADSDSELTRGLAALLCESLGGLTPQQVRSRLSP